MSDDPIDSATARFCVALIRALVAWNQAEEIARRILIGLCGSGVAAISTVAQLGNVALRDALDAATQGLKFKSPPENLLAEHIAHLSKGLDAIRPYRNFYIHSLRHIGPGFEGGAFGGLLLDTEARGRLAWVTGRVGQAEIEEFQLWCQKLAQYGNIVGINVPGAFVLGNREMLPLTSLEKPLWPAQLSKSRTYLSERPRPLAP